MGDDGPRVEPVVERRHLSMGDGLLVGGGLRCGRAAQIGLRPRRPAARDDLVLPIGAARRVRRGVAAAGFDVAEGIEEGLEPGRCRRGCDRGRQRGEEDRGQDRGDRTTAANRIWQWCSFQSGGGVSVPAMGWWSRERRVAATEWVATGSGSSRASAGVRPSGLPSVPACLGGRGQGYERCPAPLSSVSAPVNGPRGGRAGRPPLGRGHRPAPA
jgi:hypothetical protein